MPEMRRGYSSLEGDSKAKEGQGQEVECFAGAGANRMTSAKRSVIVEEYENGAFSVNGWKASDFSKMGLVSEAEVLNAIRAWLNEEGRA
jgi:hypothetical protein